MKNRYLHIDFQSATINSSKCRNDTLNCTLEELAIINIIRNDPGITQTGMAKFLGLSERTIKRWTVEMQEKKLIERENGKRNGKWIVLADIDKEIK